VECRVDDALHVVVGDGTRATDAWLIEQPIEAFLDETPAPLPNRLRIDTQFFCDILVVGSTCAPQNDARTQHGRGICSALARQSPQFHVLSLGQFKLRLRSSHRAHGSTYESALEA